MDGKFSVGYRDATVRTVVNLDRETTATYTLVLEAIGEHQPTHGVYLGAFPGAGLEAKAVPWCQWRKGSQTLSIVACPCQPWGSAHGASCKMLRWCAGGYMGGRRETSM